MLLVSSSWGKVRDVLIVPSISSEEDVSSTAIKLAGRVGVIAIAALIGGLLTLVLPARLFSFLTLPLVDKWEPSMAWSQPEVMHDKFGRNTDYVFRLAAFVFAFPFWSAFLAHSLWVVPGSDASVVKAKAVRKLRVKFVMSSCLLFFIGSYWIWRFGFQGWEYYGYRSLPGLPADRPLMMTSPPAFVLAKAVSKMSSMIIGWGGALAVPIACGFFARGLIEKRRFIWFLCCYSVVALLAITEAAPSNINKTVVVLILCATYAACIAVSWWVGVKAQPRP